MKRKILKQRINQLIDSHPAGAGFVIEALNYYSNKIIERQDKMRDLYKDHFINPEFWIDLAKKCKKEVITD